MNKKPILLGMLLVALLAVSFVLASCDSGGDSGGPFDGTYTADAGYTGTAKVSGSKLTVDGKTYKIGKAQKDDQDFFGIKVKMSTAPLTNDAGDPVGEISKGSVKYGGKSYKGASIEITDAGFTWNGGNGEMPF